LNQEQTKTVCTYMYIYMYTYTRFQLQFHTGFIETKRPIIFDKDDLVRTRDVNHFCVTRRTHATQRVATISRLPEDMGLF